MKLIMIRNIFDDLATEGEMFIEEVIQPRWCYTMEVGKKDPARPKGPIPVGVYDIQMIFSPHFGMDMPHLINVPNFTDIMIHPANWPHELKGCIAVGTKQERDALDFSRMAFNALMSKILAGLKAGKVLIEIREGVVNA